MNFTMPTPEELARMTPTEVENARVEAIKAAIEQKKLLSDIRTARNDLKRKDLELADKANKAACLMAEYNAAADMLKGKFWDKKDGFA